jgi:hypothetical protein
MRFKWKPNAAQRAAYKEKCLEKDTLKTYTAPFAIRNGCYVEFYSMTKGKTISGVVINSSYGAEKNQHTFTIDDNGEKVLVKGRNLYPNILKHIQGEESKKLM